MSFALQGGAGRGFGVHFEADAPGKLEGTAVVVNNEANHSRHEFRHRNGDDFDLGGREGTLPQTAIQHATHAGRVVHGLALVVNATLLRQPATLMPLTVMTSMQASLARDQTVTLSVGGGARRTTRRRVVPGVRMMILRHEATARRCGGPGRIAVTPMSEARQVSFCSS